MSGGTCRCCGRRNFGLGSMHLDCWSEHHSDPTGPWPPEHVCATPTPAPEKRQEQ